MLPKSLFEQAKKAGKTLIVTVDEFCGKYPDYNYEKMCSAFDKHIQNLSNSKEWVYLTGYDHEGAGYVCEFIDRAYFMQLLSA